MPRGEAILCRRANVGPPKPIAFLESCLEAVIDKMRYEPGIYTGIFVA